MKQKLIIFGIIALSIGACVGLFFLLSSDVTKAGDAFFAKVKEKDIPGAYLLTSNGFQKSVTEDQFRGFLESVKFTDVASVHWSGWKISTAAGRGSTGSLSGIVKTTGGVSVPVEMDFVGEGDAWKIHAIWKIRPKKDGGTPDLPPPEESSDLITRTTRAFGGAVKAGDLEPFYKITSPDFQAEIPYADFKKNFQVFLDRGFDFQPFNDVPPILSKPSALDANGILLLEGHIPGPDAQVNFEYHYVFRDGEWKILKITLSIGKPAPPRSPGE